MPTNDTMARLSSCLLPALLTVTSLTALAACQTDTQSDGAATGSTTKPKLVQAGTIQIDQTQVALLVSGNAGGGTFHYRGQPHAFSIGGLGIGGIGVSEIKATGTVYNLSDLRQFEGTYGQARWGYALGNKGEGDLWLEKTDGSVVIHLDSQRKGLALSLGADLVDIQLK